MRVTPTSGHLGAVVTGVDLSTVTADELAEIGRLIAEHLVLVFPDHAHLTDEQQIAFTLNFGEPYFHPIAVVGGATEFRAGHIVDDREHPPYQDKWHTDVSWDPQPPVFGTLRMVQPAERGGDTVFVSTCAAYDALSEPIRTMIDGLTAVHTMGSTASFRSKAGDAIVDATLARFPGAVHPVVGVHPVTGRRFLNVNAEFTDRIVELTAAESRAVLDLLFAHCTNPNFALRHHWTVGDVVMWDERPTLHLAVADYWPQRREVVRVNVR